MSEPAKTGADADSGVGVGAGVGAGPSKDKSARQLPMPCSLRAARPAQMQKAPRLQMKSGAKGVIAPVLLSLVLIVRP